MTSPFVRFGRLYNALFFSFSGILALMCLLAFWSCTRPSLAAPIPYGDFVGTTVTYRMVTEDTSSAGDTPPLYGAPTVSGDSLDFNPVGFDSEVSGVNNSDITSGQLIFMVEANNKQIDTIRNLHISELGDLTLSGTGTDSTSVSVRLPAMIEIVEVDGIAIPPIELSMLSTPPLPVLDPMFRLVPSNAASDGTFQLVTDGGGGPIYTTQWGGTLFVDLHDALIQSGTSFQRGITKINVTMANILSSTSEAETTARIAKKDVDGLTITTNIPEPGTATLALGAILSGLMLARRGRS